MNNKNAWQLKMFQKTLKKKLKIEHIKKHITGLDNDDKCLMISCGENNGAMNYHLRKLGGQWTWAEMEEDNVNDIEQLLDEPVVRVDESSDRLPFPDDFFDFVAVIDCHEHLNDPHTFNLEVARITKSTGYVVVSVPNGDERKLAVTIKKALGMTEKIYGHEIIGYTVLEMSKMLENAGLIPQNSSNYSKFFTEILELFINFTYVKILSRKDNKNDDHQTIVPTTKDQLDSVSRAYKMYSLVYPLFWMISQLDKLLFFTTGYAVVVGARKD